MLVNQISKTLSLFFLLFSQLFYLWFWSWCTSWRWILDLMSIKCFILISNSISLLFSFRISQNRILITILKRCIMNIAFTCTLKNYSFSFVLRSSSTRHIIWCACVLVNNCRISCWLIMRYVSIIHTIFHIIIVIFTQMHVHLSFFIKLS